MAGHSKFKNIQHRKGAQDKKRAKLFTRLVREIITAARSGNPDPEFNPRLRNIILDAKSMNLPKERIDRAIASATNNEATEDYNEIRYEGYAPGGIALIVEALTDNKNRTASDVRSSFAKFGGNLGETGSVCFMFDHVGIICYQVQKLKSEEAFETATEAGAIDIESDDEYHIFYTEKEEFAQVLDNLRAKLGSPEEAVIGWKPKSTIEINDQDKIEKLQKLIEAIEESDDVQMVYNNVSFTL
ncbi:MAG: YebC/PmpR family DNA-binding transcriptional regulator [Rickettsiaceae bacterium]|nr:YebC/PmpR family DNA-binding transcriptional regulator [Rickettsiaceae bacterium]